MKLFLRELKPGDQFIHPTYREKCLVITSDMVKVPDGSVPMVFVESGETHYMSEAIRVEKLETGVGP